MGTKLGLIAVCVRLCQHMGGGRSANGVRKNGGCFIKVLVVLVAAATSYCTSDVHTFHRRRARIQLNIGYDDLNASGAQEWSVLFRAARWSQGCSVNASSRRQALPAKRGGTCFLLQLGAYGDALGDGVRHRVISVGWPSQGWWSAVRDRMCELDSRLAPFVDSMRCELNGEEV